MTSANEAAWLLQFFSLSTEQQWRRVPKDINEVWVSTGDVDTSSDRPMEIMALVLVSYLHGWANLFKGRNDSEEEELVILDELRVLITWFMIESGRDSIFLEPTEPDELFLIWRVVRRLCRDALRIGAVASHLPEGLSVGYFFKKFTVEIDK